MQHSERAIAQNNSQLLFQNFDKDDCIDSYDALDESDLYEDFDFEASNYIQSIDALSKEL